MTVEVREVNHTVAITTLQMGMVLSPVEREALDLCLRCSHNIWVGIIDEKVTCAWGIIPPTIMSNVAYLWLHSTDIADEDKFVFIRHSQIQIKKLLLQYDVIVGHVRVENHSAIRWLNWLGAEFARTNGGLKPFAITAPENRAQLHG